MSTTFASFSVTVVYDLVIFAGCLSIFNFLRQSPHAKKIYAPKRYTNDSRYDKPEQLPETYLVSWIRPLLKYTEEDVIRIAGYDALVYLWLFSFGIRLFAVIGLFNLAVVLPVNLSDDRVDTLERLKSGELTNRQRAELEELDSTIEQEASVQITDFEESETVSYEIGSFDKLSMTNIKPGSARLWAHLLSIWFITIYTLKLLWAYHHKAVELRIRFLATTENGAEAHTVLVTDVPGLRYGSVLDRVMKSTLFRFLPAKMRHRIETSIDLLVSVASQGMSQVNNLSAQVAQTLTDQLQAPKRPSLKKIKNRGSLGSGSRQRFLDIPLERPKKRHINPDDVTDMDPMKWVTTKIADEMSLEEIVQLQFRDVYPEGLVKCATVIQDLSALEKLLSEYNTTVERLEDLVDHYTTKINDGMLDVKPKTKKLVPLMEGKWTVEIYGSKPVDVDLMAFYVNKLQYVRMRILAEQSSVTHEKVPAAFVTFRTRWAQTVAANAFHHHFPTFWNVQAAPHPQELVWENLKYRGWERMVRYLLAWGAFTVLCLFFFIPVAFVQGMIQMDRLEKYPVIGPIVTFPLLNAVLKGIVPNLALKLFLAILPSILKAMSHRQGLISLSAIDFEVVRKYFIFQTITVFFFSFIAGSFLSQIQEIKDNPSSIRDILGVAAPQAATFFISYILYSGLFQGGISFLNPINLVRLWLMSRFAGTERAKARIWKDQTIEYGVEVPSHTLVILLGLAFSVVNPIILPVTLLYFLAMKLTWTYNMMYIYSEEYQSGGKLWEHIFEHVIVGLVIMQSMMMGLFAIKKFPYSAFLIPLPFLTLLFRTVVHRLYDKPLRMLSLRAAHDLDVADEEEMAEGHEEADLDRYKHPALLIDWAEMENLISDAESVAGVLRCLNGNSTKREYLPPVRGAV